MSGKWVGFTDDDIRKLSTEESKVLQKPIRAAKLQSNSLRHQAKKNVARERISHAETQSKIIEEGKPLMSNDMQTNNPQGAESLVQGNDTSAVVVLTEESDSTNALPPAEDLQPSASGDSPNHVSVCLRIKEGRSYEVMGSEKVSLGDFQARQKLMEEQNRRRKELLAKALADRKKQTHAEAQRLQQIQEELQKLDMLLSNDVSILRNQIEVASLEFNEAQKRYNKAEKEFLDAKLKMFGKLEQKELLTEHLCTIIEQNEMRKARKLSELMEKLELGVIIGMYEDHEIRITSPPLNATVESVSKMSESSCNTDADTRATSPIQINVIKGKEHPNEKAVVEEIRIGSPVPSQ